MNLITPDDPQFAREVATFNSAITHAPAAVAAVSSAEDVSTAIRLARTRGWSVAIQGAGHGAFAAQRGGLLISTRGLDALTVDAAKRTAQVGAGLQWAAVVAAAAQHGLAAICGSAPTVGVAGYLVGGGLGPLARSHGVSSDYAVGFSVVTGAGEPLEVSGAAHPELFWALRGGKYCGAVVTGISLKLPELKKLYGGSLFFDTPHLEAAFRGWLEWTRRAHPKVSTSAATVRFPPVEAVPAPLRGRRLLSIRFAYPGDAAEGAELAAPLRKLAPVYLDQLAELDYANVARIHNDPTQPVPSIVGGQMLTHGDAPLADLLLEHTAGNSPIAVLELRHLGEQTRRDVPEGSAVSGREAQYALGWLGNDPSRFATDFPAATRRLKAALAPWRSKETLINFLGEPESPEHVSSAWSPEAFARLVAVRRRYDPDAILHTPWS